jgi:GT2 family glycosyltransferase
MISVIICSINEVKFQAVSAMYARLLANDTHEIIRISDARSLAEGYNRGIKASRGQTLILSHDDIEILSPDFSQVLASRLSSYDLIGVAGTTLLNQPTWIAAGLPHIFGQVAHPRPDGYCIDMYSAACRVVGNIQAMDGLFLAMRRGLAEKIAFDEVNFDGFHLYDIDFTYRAFLAGFRLAVCSDILLFHASAGSFDNVWMRYGERFMRIHGHRLPRPRPGIESHWAFVVVRDRTSMIQAMTWPSW